MGDGVLPEIIPVNDYNASEGKFAASVRWLVTRVYEDDVPDKLRTAISRDDQGRLHVDTALITALTNGSLYSQAAVKIFKDHSLVNQSHAGVLRALSSHEVEVLERLDNGQVHPSNEQRLFSANPFYESAHLAMMDALMTQHVRNIVTIERTVNAVSEYTTVDDRERPMDAVDSLLFWINKICLLVRDDVEKNGMRLRVSDEGEEGLIPEMEDLYEDLCDGCCICAVVHFYRQNDLDLQSICFNDPNSIADCHYNWLKIQEFCNSGALPYNPFHFEIEDVLYLHESLQTNVNAFLADLFEFFEPYKVVTPSTPEVASPRRFVPIHGIPDLRAANQASRPVHPPRVMYPPVSQGPSRSMSMMSADSLMTNRVNSPMKNVTVQSWGANVTNFQRLQQTDANGTNGNASYSRSDSLPVASIRMALEEKRREHEKRKQKDLAQSEMDRTEKGKQAFFALMQRHETEHQDSDKAQLEQKLIELQKQVMEMQLENEMERMSRALSQPSIYNEAAVAQSPRPGYGTLPHGVHQSPYNQPYPPAQDPYYMQHSQPPQQQYNQQTMMRGSVSNGMLNYLPNQVPSAYPNQQDYGAQQYDVYGQPMTPQHYPGQVPNMMHQSAHAAVGSPGFALHQGTPIGHPQSQTPSHFGIPQNQGFDPHQGQYVSQEQQDMQDLDGQGTFRLHTSNASSSRLDPPLELNRNLTNWGLTYKQIQRPQRRTWENQTFVKSHQDLVNEPDLVPHVQEESRQSTTVAAPLKSQPASRRISTDESNFIQHNAQSLGAQQTIVQEPSPSRAQSQPQSSPPRDPSSQPSQLQSNAFVVADEAAVAEFDKIAEQKRQARKEALLAKTMKRREEIPQKVDQLEQKLAEKRREEDEKKEMAEQRKLEKELHRQRVLEDYKRRKLEKEQASLEPSLPASARLPGRGHSQPPFIRTKSTMSESTDTEKSRTLQRQRGKSNVDGDARIFVPSTAEPTLKLFAKTATKSNRSLIINALQYSVFPGAVSDTDRNKVLGEMGKSDAKHFLFLFRDQKCQYRGLYSWDQTSNTVHKICGTGPKVCNTSMMKLMFKYDSGAKSFSQVPTRSLCATIDGFSLQDQFWTKPKIPHSGTASHRDN